MADNFNSSNERYDRNAEDPNDTKNSTVHNVYEQNMMKGMTAKEAAKDAQARTGLSLVTGRRIQDKTGSGYTKKFKTKGLKYRGQYG
jgi:hypothetical protein